MGRRTLEELNLIDGFLFGVALDHEKYGRIIAKIILETVIQRKVRVGKINAEKVILPDRPGYHGIRMDAFIQEDAVDISRGDVFNIEPENKQYEKDFLSRRARYYHSRIDSKILQSGRSYAKLPDSWVIFFTSFDPFGAGRMVYTVRRHCVELPDMKIDDGAVTVFLYVDGKPDGISKDLVDLVRFIGNTSAGNACSPKLEELLGYINDLKMSPEVKEAYMTFEEYVESERREVRNEMSGEIEKMKAERDAAVSERDSIKEELDAKDEEINVAVSERDAAVGERNAALQRVRELEKMLEARSMSFS